MTTPNNLAAGPIPERTHSAEGLTKCDRDCASPQRETAMTITDPPQPGSGRERNPVPALSET
jgi:hypothetical protein